MIYLLVPQYDKNTSFRIGLLNPSSKSMQDYIQLKLYKVLSPDMQIIILLLIMKEE